MENSSLIKIFNLIKGTFSKHKHALPCYWWDYFNDIPAT